MPDRHNHFVTTPPTEQVVQTQHNQQFSMTTLAHLRQTQQQMNMTLQSMSIDFAQGKFPPDKMLSVMMTMRDLQNKIQSTETQIQSLLVKQVGSRDVVTMREMSRYLSQSEIGQRFGISQSQVSRYLSGELKPDF